uniref:Uncharacterized protein n=1 Tax=Phlebotomus papatasi TaxID=29031 RepID=A0A1B0DDF5_PHLPP
MNKFSTYELSELIEIFRTRPILWNRFNRTSRTMPERTRIIEAVAKHFGKMPGDIEKCWSAVREKYKRERASYEADVPRKYRKEKWELMDKLTFLEEVYGPAPPEPSSRKFQVGTIVEILPASSGNNVTVRRIAPKPVAGVPGELVGVGQLKLANLADLQGTVSKPESPKPIKAPEQEETKTPEDSQTPKRARSQSPVLLSPNHVFESDKSDAAESVRSDSPAPSVASSTLFPISNSKSDNMEFKISRKSRLIRKMEDERRELLGVLKVLTKEKTPAEVFGEYLTKKLTSWSTDKQKKAIKMFNNVISELDDDED